MTRIALVVPGGVDRSGKYRVIPALVWLVKRLARRYDLQIFSLHQDTGPSPYPLLGATVHAVGGGGRVRTRARALREIVRVHEQKPLALLHAFFGAPGAVASLAGRLLRRPVLLHLVGGELVALPDIGYGGRCTLRGRVQLRFAMSTADRIAALSEPLRDLAAELGYPTIRLPFGVDLEEWPSRPPRPRDVSRPARLLHVASLNRVKDPHMLLRATARLAALGSPFSLDVVGVDTLEGEIQRTAASLGLSDRVRFHGFLTQEQLRPLVQQADVLLVSSRHEAGPVVLLEAAAAGVPTVGTAVGYVKEWAPTAAVAVPVGDDRALASETAALLSNDLRRRQIAAAAWDRALREDADHAARLVLQTYSAILGGDGGCDA